MLKHASKAFAVGLMMLVGLVLGGCSYEKVDEIWTDGQDYLVAVDRDIWRKVVQDGRASGAAAELLRRANELLDADGPVELLAAQSSLSGRSLAFAVGQRGPFGETDVEKLYLVQLEADGYIESGSIARSKHFYGFRAVGDACFTLFADGERQRAGASFVLTGAHLKSGNACQTGEAVSVAFKVAGQTTPGKFVVQSTEQPTEWRVELDERVEINQFFIAPDSGVAAIVGREGLLAFQRRTGKKLGSFRAGVTGSFTWILLTEQLILWSYGGFARRDVDSRWWPIEGEFGSEWRLSPSRRWVASQTPVVYGFFPFPNPPHWRVEELPVRGASDAPTRPRILSESTIWLAR